MSPDDSPETTADPLAGYIPVILAKRHDGWTAERQRRFLANLAETGSASVACGVIGMSARSAYRLRARPDATAFATSWEAALACAARRSRALRCPLPGVEAASFRQVAMAFRMLKPQAFERAPRRALAPRDRIEPDLSDF